MLAKHGHTEAKSTERQQHISELDTENTTSISFFVQNMETGFAECFSSFLGFSTYLLHIKSCKENSADSRAQRTRQGFPSTSESVPGKRALESETKRRREGVTQARGCGIRREEQTFRGSAGTSRHRGGRR